MKRQTMRKKNKIGEDKQIDHSGEQTYFLHHAGAHEIRLDMPHVVLEAPIRICL